MELERFVDATLARLGCVTQVRGAERVEALLPPPVAESLGLPDEVCLRLCGAASPSEHHAGYGSGLLSRLCSLADGVERRYRLELAPAPPKRERVERDAEAVLSFQNGVARILSFEESVIEYAVFDFRCTALSEDQHEGLVSVAVGTEGGCSPSLAADLAAYVSEHPEARRPWSGVAPDARPSYRRARLLALSRALFETQSFVARMGRRLERDTHRVEEYYEALRNEVERRRSRARDDAVVLHDKLAAIDAERGRRLQDMQRRYAVRLRLQPLAMLSIRIRGVTLRAQVQRRKTSVQVRLGWNAIAREFDHWTCDACGAETRVPTLCDALHRLCASCTECPLCSRGASPRPPAASIARPAAP